MNNAPPLVHSFNISTLISFVVPRNLLAEKGRLETRLNGGSSSVSQKFSCDNSNTENPATPTNNPVPNRIAPRQLPGVYMILCLTNNKRYFGESSNVSARLSQHKSKLRRNIHEIPELQRDWNLYGESFFEFSVLFLSMDYTKTQREALELEYIARHHDLCYNQFFQNSRKKENNPFWGRKHSAEARKDISKARAESSALSSTQEGLAIMLKGEVYPSISEASRQTQHSRDTIRRWVNDPDNMTCGLVDASQPHQSGASQAQQLQPNTGLARPVSLDGTIYLSIAEAARQLGCSRANIQRRLRTDRENGFLK